VEGREREGPKLLLNQGPSEPCYATAAGKEKHKRSTLQKSSPDRGVVFSAGDGPEFEVTSQ